MRHLTPLLQNKTNAWLLLAIAIIITLLDNFFLMRTLVGGWHIVLYLLLLAPLVYFIVKKEVKNPYTKWFILLLLIMIFDMFYYNNTITQQLLPLVFYILVTLLYITSMNTIDHLYKTFIPSLTLSNNIGFVFAYIKAFFVTLLVEDANKSLYTRVGIAFLITIPFLAIFMALLLNADAQYASFIKDKFMFHLNFEVYHFFTVPLYFLAYLFVFIYGLSNTKTRLEATSTKKLDLLIVGIFLGMINFLFLSFILLQIPFLLNTDNIPQGMNIADFAREGFFQLMMVMGLVFLIFLVIIKRFKGEKSVSFLLVGLLLQSIIMGIVSLKKMYLYQSLLGATVLRYYVEWFDYFLLIVLLLGIVFTLKNYTFAKLLNILTLFGLITFTSMVSVNIDNLVAKTNIEIFLKTKKLDTHALTHLSIDALPIVETYKKQGILHFKTEKFYTFRRKKCSTFATYHLGYCTIYKKYAK